jgi:hypothetical protein
MKPCKHGHTEGRYKNGVCIGCQHAATRKWYVENRSAVQKRATEWKKANRGKVLASDRRRKEAAPHLSLMASAKHRAKLLSLPFELKTGDFVVPNFCPVLGIPLAANRGRGISKNSPTLDRIIPELGYVPGNVVVISAKANVMKNDGTPEQLRAVADWLERVYPQWLLTGTN